MSFLRRDRKVGAAAFDFHAGRLDPRNVDDEFHRVRVLVAIVAGSRKSIVCRSLRAVGTIGGRDGVDDRVHGKRKWRGASGFGTAGLQSAKRFPFTEV